MRFTYRKFNSLRHQLRKRVEYVYRTYFGDRFLALAYAFEGKPAKDFRPLDSLRKKKLILHTTYNLTFAFLLALLLRHSDRSSVQLWAQRAGDIAEQDISAPVTAEVEPKEVNKTRLDEIARNVAPVFDYDDTQIESWIRRWEQAFQTIRREFYGSSLKVPKNASPRTAKTLEAINTRLLELTGQDLGTKELTYLHENAFGLAMEQSFIQVAGYLRGRLIAPSNLFPLYYNTGIELRLVNQSMRGTLIRDISRIWSVDQAKDYIENLPSNGRANREGNLINIIKIVSHTIVPNLELNQVVTAKRTAKVISVAKKNPVSFKRGDLIVRRGERITEDQMETIQSLQTLTSTVSSAVRFSLSFVFLFVFITVLFRLNIAGRAFWNLHLRDAMVFLLITLFTVTLIRVALPYLRLFFLPLNGGYGVEYLMPLSAGGIIIHLMMGKEAAFTFATLIAVTVGYLLEQNYYFTVYAFAMTAAAIQSIRSCKQRTDLYRSGAWSGLIGALLVITFSVTQYLGSKTMNWSAMGIAVALAFLSGMLSSVITSSLIPIFEAVFGYTTSLKLLELSNFNHPLLHSLMMKAPGTYHHSVIVGSLAEIAADQIKANSLLARVSSYYHDIGKMNKPLYFIENQTPSHNAHDHLQPSMSAKILFSHVKDGAKLGREHNLGANIVSIIEQHHGTTLVSYFLNKAKKLEKPELDPVEENQFRYPGPRPQTREAAIVMLADACEAATRSISEPTAAKIQSMVHNIINRRFLEEQFNECDLTLSDLKVIEECFTRTLVSLYHHRIEYPGQKRSVAPIPQFKKAQGGSREG